MSVTPHAPFLYEIEPAVGRELQFIRINGAIVGLLLYLIGLAL